MSKITPEIRAHLLAFCEKLHEDDDVVELVGRGGSKKGRIQRVHTAAGAATYGVPIGTLITADVKAAAGMLGKPGGVTPGGGGSKTPGVKVPGLNLPKAPAVPKPAKSDVAGQFNADPSLKMKATVTHPRIPGAKVYSFSDGTGVIEDAKGNRSKRQKLDMNILKSKGWNVQEHNDDQTDTQVSSGFSADNSSHPGRARSHFEASEQTLKILAATTPRANNKQADALMAFGTNGPQVNAALRKGGEPGENNLKTIDGLREILSNSKTSQAVTVHKGMSFGSPDERDTFVQTALKPGTSFVDRGFSVASANPDKALLHADQDNAENPGLIMHVAVPEKSRAVSLNAATGSDSQDHDVLLPDGAKYKVQSVKYDGGGRPTAEVTYIDPQLPAHERLKYEEDPAITPEAKTAAHASRFSWSPNDIQLDHLPVPAGDAPAPPSAQKNGAAGGTISRKPSADGTKPSVPGASKPSVPKPPGIVSKTP